MKIAIVGAGGFVGMALAQRLARDGHEIVPIVRTPAGIPRERVIDDLLTANWDSLLTGVAAVVHLAARVHIMHDSASDPLAEFRRVNRDGAVRVAEAASRQRVKRLVFVSTVKVNGERTQFGKPFRADDPPRPEDPYGISKHEAEQALFRISASSSLEVTMIRPPLVYGSGVRGNLQKMIQALRKGVPLPLGSVQGNRRSLVGLDNLVDLISIAIVHPAAAGQIFLVSDGEDISTTQLLRLLGRAMGRPVRLLPIPSSLISVGAKLVGKGAAASRLLGNLQIDITKTRNRLGWSPSVPIDEGLRKAVTPER